MVLTLAGATVVVTGAGGFIGRAACTTLCARGATVRGLVRTLDADTAARPQFIPVGDLVAADDARLASLLQGATHVVHLAARVHQPAGTPGAAAAEMRRTNADLTQRLARASAAAGVGHFVFASTVKVNGETTLPGHPFRESDAPDPHDAYAASKWEAEQALAILASDVGLRVTALRLPLIYGPGAKANFAALLRAVRAGVPLPFAALANRRSLLGIDNLGDALAVVLADAAGERQCRMTPYLLADAEPVSTPDLVRAIAQAMGRPPRLFALPLSALRFAGVLTGRTAAIERLVSSLEVDTTAFRARFAWTPPRTLAEGLAAALRPAAPL